MTGGASDEAIRYATALLAVLAPSPARAVGAAAPRPHRPTAAAANGYAGPSRRARSPTVHLRRYPGTAPDAATFPLTLTDGTGQSVTIAAPPAKIASLDAAHTEILYAIGAGDQVSADDNYSDCPDAAAALPHIDSFNISLEAITAQQPDLVILGFTAGRTS